jgi:hypothetical protein
MLTKKRKQRRFACFIMHEIKYDVFILSSNQTWCDCCLLVARIAHAICPSTRKKFTCMLLVPVDVQMNFVISGDME